jgi:RNA polymerase sigma-70 factor (sigma-E family)
MTLEELVAERLPAVLRLAAVLTGNRADAEDVVQEVLVRAHRDWQKLSRMDRPDLYIRKMVVNEFISSRRRVWRLVPSGSGSEVDDRVTPDHATTHADRQALLARLAKLPARQRAVLVLRYYEGLPDATIAEILGCAPVTVRSCVHRALARLRVEMTEPTPLTALAQETES